MTDEPADRHILHADAVIHRAIAALAASDDPEVRALSSQVAAYHILGGDNPWGLHIGWRRTLALARRDRVLLEIRDRAFPELHGSRAAMAMLELDHDTPACEDRPNGVRGLIWDARQAGKIGDFERLRKLFKE